jgi:L-arabinose isomerase
MKSIKAGLLPLYLEIYDQKEAYAREGMERFLALIGGELERRGLRLAKLPICRLHGEFAAAVRSCEDEGVDAIVTLHLAYSPSLESAAVLSGTRLPLVLLDTTPDRDFGEKVASDRIMYNHGIHGVQDLCNLLMRAGKAYDVEAGHWEDSDVLDRVVSRVRGAAMAASLRRSRVGSVGGPFNGMGDFQVPPAELESDLGIKTLFFDFERGAKRLAGVGEAEVDDEVERMEGLLDRGTVSNGAYRESIRTGLALRRWMEEEKLDAFTLNFMVADDQPALPRLPFIEACLAMRRGIGYAGEGDILTAALVGSLLSVVSETTFAEMFCPDWAHDRVLLSHMGEMNPGLMEGKPSIVEQGPAYTHTGNPVALTGRLRPGRSWMVNLAPAGRGRYKLILSPGDIELPPHDALGDTVHGWFKPALPLARFLERYSRAGGTHHCALCYGELERELESFASAMGWDIIVLRGEASA